LLFPVLTDFLERIFIHPDAATAPALTQLAGPELNECHDGLAMRATFRDFLDYVRLRYPCTAPGTMFHAGEDRGKAGGAGNGCQRSLTPRAAHLIRAGITATVGAFHKLSDD
jgi:hypothetical protein